MTGRLTWSRYAAYWVAGLLATFLVMQLCLRLGADGSRITFGLPDSPEIVALRWTRVLSAALVGAALAASGVLLQALLKNPLADPYVLGISTGSSVAVVAWLIGGTSVLVAVHDGRLPAWIGHLVSYGEVFPALIGALLTCIVVFALARGRGEGGPILEPLTLLLVGVVVSAFCGSLIVLLNATAPQGVRADILNFLVGNISDGTSPTVLAIAAAVFAAGWLAGLTAGAQMNLGSLSDTEAASLGLRIGRLRTLCFVAASVMTAAAIALARAIGFVGLICPHVCRLIFGPDHRQLLVTAPFCGAIFLMLADALVLVTRPIFPYYVPVGVVTALAGGPFFLVLLRRRRGAM